MKGVILAGGSGSRLGHLTEVTNKHLLPVGKYPMIRYPLYKMLEAGITEIMVVTGCEHIGSIVGYLGSGSGFSCNLTYRVQDKPGGIAEALYLAKDFCGRESVCVLLGDNIFEDKLKKHVQSFENPAYSGAIVMLYGFCLDPKYKTRFGTALIEKTTNEIRSIIEKPTEQEIIDKEDTVGLKTGIVTGIYFYDSSVFEKITRIPYSSRGEKEITAVNNMYIKEKRLMGLELKGKWTDAGTYESLLKANEMVSKWKSLQ